MSEQKLLVVNEGTELSGPTSRLLRGDPEFANPDYWYNDKEYRFGIALPALLKEGWKVKKMTAGGQNGWLVLVEK